jgi:hypothetical protein
LSNSADGTRTAEIGGQFTVSHRRADLDLAHPFPNATVEHRRCIKIQPVAGEFSLQLAESRGVESGRYLRREGNAHQPASHEFQVRGECTRGDRDTAHACVTVK